MPEKTASWVIREKATKRGIYETYNPDLVAKLNTQKYEAVPILEYLQELNLKIKADKESSNA